MALPLVLVIACAGFFTVTSAQDWERDSEGYLHLKTAQPTPSPKVKQPPRAVPVPTPSAIRRRMLVATPKPTASATPVATATPGPEESVAAHEPVIAQATPVPVPIFHPPRYQQKNQQEYLQWIWPAFLFALIAVILLVNRQAKRAKKPTADPPKQLEPVVYHDYGQYQLALQLLLTCPEFSCASRPPI